MTTPTYMKDESGFCYTWTEHLAKLAHMSPYDGDVDELGFATTEAPTKPAKPALGKPKKEAPVAPPAPVDPLDAALAAATLD